LPSGEILKFILSPFLKNSFMSIKGAGVSFSLGEVVHPAINNSAVNEIRISLLFFIIVIFVIPNLNNDVAKVNFFLNDSIN
jgi:hypothetical protein